MLYDNEYDDDVAITSCSCPHENGKQTATAIRNRSTVQPYNRWVLHTDTFLVCDCGYCAFSPHFFLPTLNDCIEANEWDE